VTQAIITAVSLAVIMPPLIKAWRQWQPWPITDIGEEE
jgi:hypothetical protein